MTKLGLDFKPQDFTSYAVLPTSFPSPGITFNTHPHCNDTLNLAYPAVARGSAMFVLGMMDTWAKVADFIGTKVSER